MRIFARILTGALTLILLLAVVGLFLPDSVHVERSTLIDAPRSVVFRLISDLRRFNEWQPWADIDPDGTTYTFSGPDSGVGQTMRWESDHPEVGSGLQMITAAEPNRYVEFKLDFGPQGEATSFFRLIETDAGTEVTWNFYTEFGYDLVGRYFGLVIDSAVGEQYALGLMQLEALAESLPVSRAPDVQLSIVDVEPRFVAYVSSETGTEAAVTQTLAKSFDRVESFLTQYGLEQAGPRMAITRVRDEEARRWVYDAAIPIDRRIDVPEDAEVTIRKTYAGPALRAVHRGPYPSFGATYDLIESYIADNDLTVIGPSWEEYVAEPAEVAEGDLETHIYFPVE